MGAFRVEGSFDKFSGQMMFDKNEILKINCIIQVSSINTDNNERDEILRSEPYFDINQFPVISYWADRLSKEDQGLRLHGRLTIKRD